jgi:hypothetical protein
MKKQLLFSLVFLLFSMLGFSQQKHQVQAQFNTVCETLSVSSLEAGKVQLYPNPVKETLFISSNINAQKITVYDVMGKVVKSIVPDLQNHSYDVSDLLSGIYFIVIETTEQSNTYKIIVE